MELPRAFDGSGQAELLTHAIGDTDSAPDAEIDI